MYVYIYIYIYIHGIRIVPQVIRASGVAIRKNRGPVAVLADRDAARTETVLSRPPCGSARHQ